MRNKQLKTKQLLNQTFSPEKIWNKSHQSFSAMLFASWETWYTCLIYLTYLLCYLIHILLYTQNVGFRTLLNQMNSHLSWLYVNMASMMVLVHMLQIGENAIHRIFVEWVFFMKSIFSCLDLKPDDESLPNRMPEVFN